MFNFVLIINTVLYIANNFKNKIFNRIKCEIAYTRSKLDLKCPIILLYTFKIQIFSVILNLYLKCIQ